MLQFKGFGINSFAKLLIALNKLKWSRLAVNGTRAETPDRTMLSSKHPIDNVYHPRRNAGEVMHSSFESLIDCTKGEGHSTVLSPVLSIYHVGSGGRHTEFVSLLAFASSCFHSLSETTESGSNGINVSSASISSRRWTINGFAKSSMSRRHS
jgi:hypothetical protein